MDTAAWINGITLPNALPVRIRRLLQGEEPKGLATVSLLETAILHRLGRLRFDGELADLFSLGLALDVELLELAPAIALKTNDLPDGFPGDPFDRVLVATAAALNLTLITADSAILDSGACDVEYYPFRPAGS